MNKIEIGVKLAHDEAVELKQCAMDEESVAKEAAAKEHVVKESAPKETQQKFEFGVELVKGRHELCEMSHQWTPLHIQLSQTKLLPFITSTKQTDDMFAKANQPSEIFRTLLPKKVMNGICNQINAQLRAMFQGQIDERNLRKKLFKPDQLYEYFGVKIMMGYCRMPDPEDYFNATLPFKNHIGDLIKEGRFKCVESLTVFTDDILSKQPQAMKQEYMENAEGQLIPKVMKKLNKLQKKACIAGQLLTLNRNQFFEHSDSREQISCLYLLDVATQFVLNMSFQQQSKQEPAVLTMLSGFSDRNHKVYVHQNLMSMEAINHLAMRQAVYCHSIISNAHDIRFNRADLLVNGQLTLQQTKSQQLLVSAADGFHKSNLNDRRPFATTSLSENLKRGEQYAIQSEQYKCQFSCNTLSGALLTEVLEMLTWNSYVLYKTILKRNIAIEYLDYRLMLAKEFLESKIKLLSQTVWPTLPLQYPKTTTQAIQTETLTSFQFQSKTQISLFHIPIVLTAPVLSNVLLQCIVCRKSTNQLTQCANCSEVSGRLVALCASECFALFHMTPREYISNSDDIPQASSKGPLDPNELPKKTVIRQEDTQLIFTNENDDLWDDCNMRRRVGRPVGSRNRRRGPTQNLAAYLKPDQKMYNMNNI